MARDARRPEVRRSLPCRRILQLLAPREQPTNDTMLLRSEQHSWQTLPVGAHPKTRRYLAWNRPLFLRGHLGQSRSASDY